MQAVGGASQGPRKCCRATSGNKWPWKVPKNILMAWTLPHPGQKQEAIDRLFTHHFKVQVELSLHGGGQKLPFDLKKPAPADLSLSPPTATYHLFLIAPATSGNFTESQGSGSIFVLKTLKTELGRPDV